MKNASKALVEGALSGICIGLGGGVWLSVMGESRIAGAVLFSVALLTICFFGFNLYTGRIGFIAFEHKKSDFVTLFGGLAGNAAGALAMGLLTTAGLPAISAAARTSVEAKLAQTPVETLIRAFMCGLLMFIAVWIFKKKSTPIGILFAIPVFILSGYEHSIADMYYCFADGVWSARQALFVALALCGNTVGGLTIPLLMKASGRTG